MAIIYPPGSILGPCPPTRAQTPDAGPFGAPVRLCAHLACEHDRWVAAQRCGCGLQVGYDTPFTVELWDHDPEGNPVVRFNHTVCVALSAELDDEYQPTEVNQ